MKKVLLLVILLPFFSCSSKKKIIKYPKPIPIPEDAIRCFPPPIVRPLYYEIGKIFPKNINIVDTLYNIMRKHPEKEFVLQANTDIVEYNIDSTLNKKRLKILKDLFVQKGFNSKKIYLIDNKANFPIDNPKTENGRANNRRIEVKQHN